MANEQSYHWQGAQIKASGNDSAIKYSSSICGKDARDLDLEVVVYFRHDSLRSLLATTGVG